MRVGGACTAVFILDVCVYCLHSLHASPGRPWHAVEHGGREALDEGVLGEWNPEEDVGGGAGVHSIHSSSRSSGGSVDNGGAVGAVTTTTSATEPPTILPPAMAQHAGRDRDHKHHGGRRNTSAEVGDGDGETRDGADGDGGDQGRGPCAIVNLCPPGAGCTCCYENQWCGLAAVYAFDSS